MTFDFKVDGHDDRQGKIIILSPVFPWNDVHYGSTDIILHAFVREEEQKKNSSTLGLLVYLLI